MPWEVWKFYEEEKKKKKITKKIWDKEQIKKIVAENKKKASVKTKIETDEKLFSLKELIKKWYISEKTSKKIIDGERLWDEGIKEIFDKIDEIENIKDINKYLPLELRISRDDYKKAISNSLFRNKVMIKIDKALTILANQISWDYVWWINLFTWFLSVLDKNLIKIQENTIDLKENLEEINEKENPKQKLSLWEKIVKFFKELLNQ